MFTRHYWGTSKVSRVLLIGPVAAATIAAPVDSLKVASVAAAPLNDCVSSDNGDPIRSGTFQNRTARFCHCEERSDVAIPSTAVLSFSVAGM